MDGAVVWTQEVRSVVRTRPVLHDGMLLFHRQVYLPDDVGHFTNENKDAPRARWTQLQALNAATGEPRWLSDDKRVLVVYHPLEQEEWFAIENASELRDQATIFFRAAWANRYESEVG